MLNSVEGERDELQMLESDNKVTTAPSVFEILKREFKKSKGSMIALIIFTILMLVIFLSTIFIDQEKIMTVSLLNKYARPLQKGYILGADSGGRSILGQLLIGARNSIVIGFTVTLISQFVGVTIGLISGYYAGKVDNFIMRIVDFIMILPSTMIIIVFVTITKQYTAFKFIFILTMFLWIGTARLIRSKALSEARKDYIQASKTLGTRDIVIMVRELLPNISSIILVDLTLGFAGNIGIETGLTYLGYGLPPSTPSLGTLISYATKPEIMSEKIWVWLPASLLILVLTLCINAIGQTVKRATDARQRLG